MAQKLAIALFALVFACLASRAASAADEVSENPAVLGATHIGPAPDFNCTENGAHPHETNCEYFYECWEGDAILGLCTEMQLYSLKWKGCDFAQNVDCGDRIRPTGYPGTVTPPMTEEPPTDDPSAPTEATAFDCVAAGGDGFHPHPDDCGSYFFCWGGFPFLFECPPGLHFNQATEECDYPAEAGCAVKLAR